MSGWFAGSSFPDQGLNPCLLQCSAESQPLATRERPKDCKLLAHSLAQGALNSPCQGAREVPQSAGDSCLMTRTLLHVVGVTVPSALQRPVAPLPFFNIGVYIKGLPFL